MQRHAQPAFGRCAACSSPPVLLGFCAQWKRFSLVAWTLPWPLRAEGYVSCSWQNHNSSQDKFDLTERTVARPQSTPPLFQVPGHHMLQQGECPELRQVRRVHATVDKQSPSIESKVPREDHGSSHHWQTNALCHSCTGHQLYLPSLGRNRERASNTTLGSG